MDIAIWSEELSVDINLIDNQHKWLIRLINDTSRLILKNDVPAVKKVIQELRDYTVTHFREEEELFLNSDYPHGEKHLAEHKVFIEKLNEFDRDFQGQDTSISLDILLFLKNWLFYHIEIVDKVYAPYVKKAVMEP
ncbi:MAG: hemerythrin family protein [Spirochaetaceae bacterium]|nr:hemerythrin family protein [Spirochaetaceae bacterium]